MAEQQSREPRKRETGAVEARHCPWCGGRLELQPSFPRQAMVPGEVRAWTDWDVPEALRTVRAWVCSRKYCRYRESA
jgi:hypothetical protein